MESSPDPVVSLVIPAYNETKLLPRLLDTVDEARRRYHRGPAAVEVIVADNGSTDGTAAMAAARGCTVVPVSKRMIAAVRNGAAARAAAPILCLTDADMQIHPETFNAVERALDDPRVIGGATGVTMERWSLGIAASYATLLPLVWLTGMDTGVVFCRRADFVTVGGYDETKHFAEDVDFLRKLIRLGRSRRQRLVRLRPFKAVASVRKFDRYGDWHYVWLPSLMLWSVIRDRTWGSRDVRRYWYEDR
jgi:glycosyltransferase involved in cell wall biosynthesis